MKFDELTPKEQELAKQQFEKLQIKDVDYSEVDVSPDKQGGMIVRYKDWNVVVPIKSPDQNTSNHIWSFLAGCFVVLVGVFFGSKLGGKVK